MKPLLLFDVDGTIAESGKSIDTDIHKELINLVDKYDLGIVGGGKFEKIIDQIYSKNCEKIFKHIFSECGCVYHKLNELNEYDKIYVKELRKHPKYENINKLIKVCLKYLSEVDYILTGNFVDLRNGIIYVSLIGMCANQEERDYFIEIDKKENIRKKLINILREQKYIQGITVLEGGSVGIGIYPNEYDKIQVLDVLDEYINNSNISYFGDKYTEEGNDYKLLTDNRIKGYPVNNLQETKNILKKLIN